MAKQAKVFNGSASASTTQSNVPVYTCCDYYGNSYIWYYTTQTNVGTTNIYTVPSGRTAKVEVVYINYTRPNYGQGSMNMGTQAWDGLNAGGSTQMQYSNSVNSPNNLYMNNGAWVPRIYYLSAGQSISLTGPSGQTGTTSANYNFSVVEEY